MASHGRSLVLVLVLASCSDDGMAGQDGGTSTASASTTITTGESSSAGGTTTDATSTTITTTLADTSTSAVDSSGDDGPKLDITMPDIGPPGPLNPIPATCAEALLSDTTVGCEFYAIDLDQLDGGEDLQYAVAVSNVHLDKDAEVTIERKLAGVWEVVGMPIVIGPLQEHTFLLDELHQEESGVLVGGSYRVSADVPVVAYQFNPLNLEPQVASSDASMLLPVASWDHLAHVVGWEPLPQNGHGAYFTVVASQDGTTLDITPSVATLAGPGVPAGMPGVPFQIDLDAGDIVEVMTKTGGVTLSGSRIESDEDHPIGVFSGAKCTFVLAYSCDHLEDQLTGPRLWGKDFVAARVPPRLPAMPESSVWQVYASEDATTVSFEVSPAVTGVPAMPLLLDAGENTWFEAVGPAAEPGDFVVHADKPIALVNYMTGSSLANNAGDPSMVQIPPIEQYLPRYVVLVPTSWDNDFIALVREAGVAIELDGAPVDELEFVAVGEFEVARLEAADGVHTLESEEPFLVVVTGVTPVDSYSYVGGIGTAVINPTPEG